jgi:hypothetical protein
VILLNTNHPVYGDGDRTRKLETSLAPELAYLLGSDDAASVYQRMLDLLEVL